MTHEDVKEIRDQMRDEILAKCMDDLSKRILIDAWTIEAADQLVEACHAYMKSYVKHGPSARQTDMEAQVLIRACENYRERRAKKP